MTSLRRPGRLGRLVLLDGARGLSALLVAWFHIGWTMGPARGYLAVDFFFMLSGYVVAAAYEDRLKAGAALGWFLGLRIARLFPLYLFGTLLGLAGYLAMGLSAGLPGALLRALALLPARLPFSKQAYPLDGPTWSLAAEVGVNLLYAWFGFRLSLRALARVALGAGAAVLLVAIVNHGANVGSHYGPFDFLGATARVLFAFPLGVAIHRLRRSGRLPGTRCSHAVFLFALAAAYCVPTVAGMANALVDAALLFAVLPASLVGLVGAPPPEGRLAALYGWGGGVSYALYVVHVPVAMVTHAFLLRWGADDGFRVFAIAPPIALLAAMFGWRVIEPRGRSAIARIIGSRDVPPGAVPAAAPAGERLYR